MLTSAFVLQYGAEFRRFSVDRLKPGKFEEFYKLIMTIHRIANMEVMIGYADVHGDLLPINNDENFGKAVSTAHPLLRIFIQRQGTSSLPLTFLYSLCPSFVSRFFKVDFPASFEALSGDSRFAWRTSRLISLNEALHNYIGLEFFWPQLGISPLGVKNPAECRVWI